MITLLTDFGAADYFVPALKGAILSIHPPAQIIDLTHEIAPQDIAAGAFTLGACWRDFPPGTTHLAVVDPGVGSARRAIVVAAERQFLVGPDNGLFSYIYAQTNSRRVYHAIRTDLFRPHPSSTFHGRDIFAPLAAHLDRGLGPASVGPEIIDYVKFELSQPQLDQTAGATGALVGEIIHVDRFGNCITNLTARELDPSRVPADTFFEIASTKVTRFKSHFAANPGSDAPFAYLGSAGYWEIGLWCDSAASRLQIDRGVRISLVIIPS
jgi:S-adenosylmethionine hydrolase